MKRKFWDFWVVGWKFTKLLMSYSRLQVTFSLNFASLFSVKRDNSSLIFWLKLYIILTKGVHQSAKFQTFDFTKFVLDKLLLMKVYKISAKKVQRSCVSWHWRLMQNLKKNWFVVSKLIRIWWILIQALKSLKNVHFNLFLRWKVCNVWSKKVQRSYLSPH